MRVSASARVLLRRNPGGDGDNRKLAYIVPGRQEQEEVRRELVVVRVAGIVHEAIDDRPVQGVRVGPVARDDLLREVGVVDGGLQRLPPTGDDPAEVLPEGVVDRLAQELLELQLQVLDEDALFRFRYLVLEGRLADRREGDGDHLLGDVEGPSLPCARQKDVLDPLFRRFQGDLPHPPDVAVAKSRCGSFSPNVLFKNIPIETSIMNIETRKENNNTDIGQLFCFVFDNAAGIVVVIVIVVAVAGC